MSAMSDERAQSNSPEQREALMRRHVEARARRDAAPLGSDAFREAAEEIARIEVAIAAAEEPRSELARTAAEQDAPAGQTPATPPAQGTTAITR